VEYAAIYTAMEHRNPPIRLSKRELMEYCKSMQYLAPGVVFARENTVEIDRRPDLIMKDIRAVIDVYPEGERVNIKL